MASTKDRLMAAMATAGSEGALRALEQGSDAGGQQGEGGNQPQVANDPGHRRVYDFLPGIWLRSVVLV